jgi:hypothetical protein
LGAFSTEIKSGGCLNKKNGTNICKDGNCSRDGCCTKEHKNKETFVQNQPIVNSNQNESKKINYELSETQKENKLIYNDLVEQLLERNDFLTKQLEETKASAEKETKEYKERNDSLIKQLEEFKASAAERKAKESKDRRNFRKAVREGRLEDAKLLANEVYLNEVEDEYGFTPVCLLTRGKKNAFFSAIKWFAPYFETPREVFRLAMLCKQSFLAVFSISDFQFLNVESAKTFLPIKETDVNSRFLKHFSAYKSFLFKSSSRQFSFGIEGTKSSEIWLMNAKHFSLIPFPEFSTELSADDLEIFGVKFLGDRLASCRIGNVIRVYEYTLASDRNRYLELLKSDENIYGCKSTETSGFGGLCISSTVFCATCTSTKYWRRSMCSCSYVHQLTNFKVPGFNY